MTETREMTLAEWVGKLPTSHFAYREYTTLLTENQRLREQVELSRRDTEAFIRDLDDWQKRAEAAEAKLVALKRGVSAIPETTDYANGWNDCRHASYALRKTILEQP